MVGFISLWAQWLKGHVEGFHNYRLWNGKKNLSLRRQTLQLPKTICETWADMLFNERCLISVDGEDITKDAKLTSKTAAYVKHVFDTNNLWTRLNEAQELKCAYGTVAYIPRVINAVISDSSHLLGGGRLITDIVTADMLIPLSHENREITELAAVSHRTVQGKKYAYIQLFVIGSDGKYVIKNNLIRLLDAGGYDEIKDITQVRGFEKVAGSVSTNSTVKPFVIDRPNIVNNIDVNSPLGIAVYANALDTMQTCDITFDGMMNEIALGSTKIFVAPQMLNAADGKPFFDLSDRVFRFMEQPDGDTTEIKKYIDVIQPDLRIPAYKEALQLSLNLFSSQCGLGENYYDFTGGGIATATQIISEQSGAYRTKCKHEIILETVLYDLIRLFIDIGIHTLKIDGLTAEPEIKIRFDDSIIEDKASMKKQDLLEVSQMVKRPYEFRMQWYGETEEQARAVLGAEADVDIDPANLMPGVSDIEQGAEQAAGKQLNGAQTQSLITVIKQYAEDVITLGQAVNIVSTAIGIDRQEAQRIIEGSV